MVTISYSSLAQSIIGKVLDKSTDQPMAFVNVAVLGKTGGTVTNLDGVFILNIESFAENAEVSFSYVGYATKTIKVSELSDHSVIRLASEAINLDNVEIYAKERSAEDIIDRVRARFDSNYVSLTEYQQLFFHRYEKTVLADKNKIKVKSSDFVGLDKKTIDELLAMFPNEFVEYRDAVLEGYLHGDELKVKAIEAISMEEGALKEVEQTVQDKLSEFFDDLEDTKKLDKHYYKLRTGVFAFKMDVDDSLNNETEDSLNYELPSHSVADDLKGILKKFTDLDSDYWEFLNHPSRYEYQWDFETYKGQPVYKIEFQPARSSRRKAVFEGFVLVSLDDYAVLELDYRYAEGKRTEHVQLLGFGHDMYGKRGRLIFDKNENGYFPKYLSVYQTEDVSIERSFKIKKMKKRFLFDKSLSAIKFDVAAEMQLQSHWEVLVQERKTIDKEKFDQFEMPKKIKFRKEYAYSNEMWNNRTVIVPTAELQDYKRK